jgi:hypothetical protein
MSYPTALDTLIERLRDLTREMADQPAPGRWLADVDDAIQALVDLRGGEPQLGYATTRQLLEEIRARGRTEQYYREEGDAMTLGAGNLIKMLSGSMLDYRTVDS